MVTARDVPAGKLISKVKEELKKVSEIQPPAWMKFVKTGIHRERPPEQPDFWYIRSAAIMRKLYVSGPVGVSRLRTNYGGRRRRGYKPAISMRSAGNSIRKILQQLEKAGFAEKAKGGRKITAKGQKFLDRIAFEVSKE
ncbi:MAG: 30S ribosomal protein S19e [Candidatus Aenigmarchaeota archaeon]|nr:30S ribosomal protein S19e [Candidatus Aenigmarchaeota archaeon]